MAQRKDTRETILEYLQSIIAAVKDDADAPLFKNVWRNRAEVQDVDRPCVVIFEGSETLITNTDGKGIVRHPPAVYRMEPQVFILHKSRDDTTNLTLDGEAAPIGQEMTDFRTRLLNAVINDENLVGLVGTNGQVRFLGFATDMATGRPALGQQLLLFALNYPRLTY